MITLLARDLICNIKQLSNNKLTTIQVYKDDKLNYKIKQELFRAIKIIMHLKRIACFNKVVHVVIKSVG